MSRISQDFIASVGYLYEEINIQQQDFLNEESEYYDAEAAELVEDILSTISVSMVYEGYSAEGIIGFLADSSEQDIVEKYLSFDENILTESIVSEEYIEEQLEIFDVAIDEGIGSLIGKVAKGALGLAKRVATKPARMRVDKILSNAKNPERARELLQKTAQKSARDANVGGYSSTMSPIGGGKLTGKQSAELLTKAKLSQGIQKVKDIAKGAKAALTSPTAKKVALGAAGLGAAGLAGGIGGYMGAKLAGAGSGTKAPEAAKPSPADTKPAETKPPAAAKPAPAAPPSAKPKVPAKDANQQYKDLIKAGKTKEAEKLGLETWTKANQKLAAKLNPDGTQKGTGQSQMERDAEELRKMGNRSKQRQGELMGGPEGPGKIDTKSADTALKAQQEAERKKTEDALRKAASSMKESYEPYNVLLEYLMSGGHADTIEEAHYIMLEMDAAAVQTVMEEYEDYLLAGEVSEWVDGLLEEGYDLSEYSWDDLVEYYVSEANRGDEHVTSSMYMSREPETKEAKVRRR